jgi:8-oxo-dGTP pyrophosphatase MutT (NUDIX family)
VSAPGVNAAWLAQLRLGKDQPPRRGRVPLWLGGDQIGSVEPDLLRRVGAPGSLLVEEPRGWRLAGETPAQALAYLAQALRSAGLAHVWRDEQLAVNAADGRRLGTIERGVVRVLGIATQAVHLVGQAPDGRMWVQLRSRTKANDPGLWDTLVGGMVPASDSVEAALERETWEEAGLRMAQLDGVRHCGQVIACCPAGGPADAGYVVEQIECYRCIVPQGVVPVNQDGEVDEFRLMDRPELVRRLENGEFTPEAALILCDGGWA